MSYTISPDGGAITCHRCRRTSHNPHDVANHYCGHCHLFLDDAPMPDPRGIGILFAFLAMAAPNFRRQDGRGVFGGRAAAPACRRETSP